MNMDNITEFGYRTEPEKIKKRKLEGIKSNFKYFYDHNSFYRRYCETIYKYGIGDEISPEDIKTYEDLYKIPLLPSDFFKELSARGLENYIITDNIKANIFFTTSGTTGTQTKYLFDENSLKLINEENIFTCKEILNVKEGDKVIFLAPPPERSRSGLVQGAYRMFQGIVKDNIYFLYEESIEKESSKILEELMKKIKKEPGDKIHLYGPPFVYYEIAKELEEKNKIIDTGGKCMITGGWKRWKGGEIPREELYNLIAERFNIEKKDVRDGLGLTDIFMWCPECEYHKKHIPLGIHISIRDPENFNTPVESGEEGLLAFMSPYIKSYPPFVVTGDIGVETTSVEEFCECGRTGNTIEHKRRARGTLPRGCALVLEELIKRMENEEKI